jgi:hypothetical protein
MSSEQRKVMARGAVFCGALVGVFGLKAVESVGEGWLRFAICAVAAVLIWLFARVAERAAGN